MAGQTADLGEYIAEYHSECPRRITSIDHCRIFDTENRRLLKREQKSRVLLYPGCFNPPHLGHYNVLRRAFEGSQDINVIAAIVLLLDDDSLEAKCEAKGQILVLSRSERAHLWRSDARVLPQWWIYDGSVRDWHWLREDLENAIAIDGFDFQFASVLGPDYISRFESYSGWNWSCHETITSDAGRRSDLVKADGSLYTLSDDRPSAGKLTETSCEADVPKRATVKVCHRIGEETVWVRFVPADADPLDISATQIRELAENDTMSSHELCEKLRGLVLSPDMLTEIILARPTY
ncbi:Cytidylyltransferase domain-containing protein [Colletotrichum incanum]|nr:Cytidylyltransferase domain-containing protein [Colletotrichum incanum]